MALQEKELVFEKQSVGGTGQSKGTGTSAQIRLRPGYFWARPLGVLRADPCEVNASTRNGPRGRPMTWGLEGAGGFSLPPATPFPRRMHADTGQHREDLRAMLPAEGRCVQGSKGCLLIGGLGAHVAAEVVRAPHLLTYQYNPPPLRKPSKDPNGPRGKALWVDLATRPNVGGNRRPPC